MTAKTLAYMPIVEAFGTPRARLRRVASSCCRRATDDLEAMLRSI